MKDLEKKISRLSIPEKIVLVENIWDSIAENHYAELSEKEKKEL
ncbi:MAG: addiction module protein, partial [Bacteroidia bacterium]